MGIDEYHARQRANQAENERRRIVRPPPLPGSTKAELKAIREHLKRALKLIEAGTDPGIQQEITLALDRLEKLESGQ